MEIWVLKELQLRLGLRCLWVLGKGPEPEARGERREGTGRHLSPRPDAGGQGMPGTLFPGSGQGCRISWKSCQTPQRWGVRWGLHWVLHQRDARFEFVFSLREAACR